MVSGLEVMANLQLFCCIRSRTRGVGPVEEKKGDEGIGSSALQEKAERAGPVQPQEETSERKPQCLKEGCQENEARLFLVGLSNRTSGQRLLHRKFDLNMSRNFFNVWVTEPWNRLSKAMSILPHQRCSRAVWTQSCAMSSRITLLEEESWPRWPAVDPFLSHSVILWFCLCTHVCF